MHCSYVHFAQCVAAVHLMLTEISCNTSCTRHDAAWLQSANALNEAAPHHAYGTLHPLHSFPWHFLPFHCISLSLCTSPFHSPSIPLHSPGTLLLDSFLSVLFVCIPLQSPATLHSLSCISLAFPYIPMLFHSFCSHFEPTPICSPGILLHSFAFYSIHLAIAPNRLRSPGIPLHSTGTFDTRTFSWLSPELPCIPLALCILSLSFPC